MKDGKTREGKMSSRLAYGMADIYGGGAFVIVGTFFTVFLTKCYGMPTALAGTIPLIGKVWDAVTDPLMGNIVDRTKSKFGAKRFYLLIGSIFSAITFILMWTSINTDSMAVTYIYYCAMYMVFSTGFTVTMVPYNALLPDMVDDYVLRSKYSSVRMLCSSIGAILCSYIPSAMIQDNTDSKQYLTVAMVFSVVFLIAVLITFLGTWERQKPVVKISFKQSFVQSFTVYRNKSFVLFLAIFLCGQGTSDFVNGLAVYYVDDVLNAYEGNNFAMYSAILYGSQLVGTLILTPIMAKTNKKIPIQVGFPIKIVAMIAFLFFSYEGVNFNIILFLTIFLGFGNACSNSSIYAILSDMADIDELITSVSRPGTCSGMATFIRKIATGLSSTIIGILLAFVGYDEVAASEGLRQTAATQQGIALLFVFGPVLMMVLTLIFMKLFPVGKHEFEVVRKEVARRKGEDDSVATPEEIAICERVTGFSYDRLWNKDNMLKLNTPRH